MHVHSTTWTQMLLHSETAENLHRNTAHTHTIKGKPEVET